MRPHKKEIRLQNLSFQDWSKTDLKDGVFQCNLTEQMSLRQAVMDGVTAHAANFTTVDFTGASLKNAVDVTGSMFHGCRMHAADLTGANLAGSLFYQCDLSKADFSKAQLRGAVFTECRLTKTLFKEAHLVNAVFNGCEGDALDFSGACTDDMRILASSMIGTRFSSTARGTFKARGLTVRDCDLSKSAFDGAYLYRTHMTGDYYSRMRLRGTSFRGANIVNSYFSADLAGSNFTGATGDYAHFVQCDCRRTNFSGARLRGATLIKSQFLKSSFRPRVPPAFIDRCPGLEKSPR